ncbi:hypothetical protein D3C77_802850 [compost metagenome]
MAAFLHPGLEPGVVAFLLPVGIAQLLALLFRLQAQLEQLLLTVGAVVRRQGVRFNRQQRFDGRFWFQQIVK